MTEVRGRLARDEAARERIPNDGRISSTLHDTPPLALLVPPLDPEHEARIRAWAAGWDACRAWLQPQLDRANSDADRWYERANNPGVRLTELRERRMREAAEAHWAVFLEGGAL